MEQASSQNFFVGDHAYPRIGTKYTYIHVINVGMIGHTRSNKILAGVWGHARPEQKWNLKSSNVWKCIEIIILPSQRYFVPFFKKIIFFTIPSSSLFFSLGRRVACVPYAPPAYRVVEGGKNFLRTVLPTQILSESKKPRPKSKCHWKAQQNDPVHL